MKESKIKMEDSDYVKAWKSIPKEKREKLTKAIKFTSTTTTMQSRRLTRRCRARSNALT